MENEIEKLDREIEAEFGNVLNSIYSGRYIELIKRCDKEVAKLLEGYDESIDNAISELDKAFVHIFIDLESIYDLEKYKLSDNEKKFLVIILERLHDQIRNQLDMMIDNVDELKSVISRILHSNNNWFNLSRRR